MVHASGVCPVLIGRRAELAALHECMEQVQRGNGQVVLLCGEAGIGKSRLMSELKVKALAQGFHFLQGHCFPTDHFCPYAPLLDLLRSILLHAPADQPTRDLALFARELTPLLPEVTQLFPELAMLSPLPTLEPEQEKRRLFAALTRFFFTQAATRPLLLIVEDVHWSDETSLEFLHYLARHSTAQPLLLLLTYRSDEMDPGLGSFLAELDREHLAREVVLSRLTRSETDAMVRAIFDLRHSWNAEALNTIYERTEGNPFFIEELLKSLVAAGEIAYAHGSWERKALGASHIPRSVQVAVKLRADQVSPSARQVLQLAAVAGRRFDFAVLQQVTQHDEQQLLTLMKELMVAQLVVEESADHFAFRHALTRQAIYADLLGRERQAMHRTIAETMEQLYRAEISAHLEDLASHFSEAAIWEKALKYAQRAGEQAHSLYAPRAAIEQLTRALDAAQRAVIPPPLVLYRLRGQSYETLGDFERARLDYETTLRMAQGSGDRQAEWQALIDLGFLWAQRGYTQAGSYYQQALALARHMDDQLTLAHSLNRLGNWHLNIEQPREALRYHQQALTLFQQAHDSHGIAETYDLLGMTSTIGGDLLQATAYYQQAVALFRELDDRQGLASSLTTLMVLGEGGGYETETMVPATTSFAESLSFGELALKISREIGQRSAEIYTLYVLGECLGSRGEYASALRVAHEGLALAEEIEHRQWIIYGHWVLGALYLDLLVLPEARHYLERALALAHEVGSLNWIHIVSGFLAQVLLLRQDPALADSILTSALEPDAAMQTIGQRLVWAARAELAFARHDPDLALDIVDQLIASAANLSDECVIPRLWKLRGEALAALHRAAEAETMLQAAQAAAHAQGLRPWHWRICVALGKLYLTQAREARAEQAFSTARTLIEELVANISDEHLREQFLSQATAMLPRSHLALPGHTVKQTYGGLTAREREVAILVALGKTNREIAEVLVVNYRTIEKHIENILAKLGFTSRAQIAVWASEKGLGEKERS